MEDPVTPVTVESRTAVRRSMFQDNETDMPAYTMSVSSDACITSPCQNSNKNRNSGLFCRSGSAVKATFAPMTTTLSTLPTILPRKPKLDTFLQGGQGNLWKMELLDTSAESGYGTDSSDNNSLKSLNPTEPSPPPLPKRKPRRKVQFDSYVQ